MALLNRISSGLILRDTFGSPLLDNLWWQVSPSDPQRYSLTEVSGVLRMKHGSPDLFVLTNIPPYDFVFEIDTDYSPIRASDTGGIVVYRDNETRLELLEYYDPATGTSKGYNNLRVVRQGDLFSGYGSNDGGKVWELIGADFLSASKIGMVLHGITEAQSDTLDVKEVRWYLRTNIQIGSLQEGMVVKLVTPTGTLIKEETCKPNMDYVTIDVSDKAFPLAGRIELYNSANYHIASSDDFDDMWGGDVFWYGINLDIEIDGVQMRQDREYQLGNMSGGIIEKQFAVVNNGDLPITSVYVSIASLSGYAGWEWVDLATDVMSQPGTYADEQFIGTVEPGQRVPMWMKIVRRPQGQVASLTDYKFRVHIESR